jgi:predicted CoA-binding protein
MPSDDALRSLLEKGRTIAVVGLSDKPERESNGVARYLIGQGYTVVPVNPAVPEVLGLPSYPSIAAIPSGVTVDIVDIFRHSDQVGPIVDESLARGRAAIWMQTGIENAEAAGRAQKAGVPVIQNTCIMRTHQRLHIPPKEKA